jgi:hypothetical protein
MVAKRTVCEVFRSIATALAVVWVGSAGPNMGLAAGFTDVTASAGITHLQHPGNAPPPGLFRAGGAAASDFDNDGWVDLFVTRLNARPLLYRNLGNGTFQDVAVSAGFTASLPANGPAWGDIDNDGDRDLYVTSTGGTRFYLYVNNGNGTFSEQATARGAAIAGVLRYGQSATFGDYDGDGYLDIHTNDWATDTSVSTSRLLRNLGAANPGFFEDVTAAAGLDVFRPSRFADGSTDSNAYRYTSTFTDLDRDGHPDLAIAADFHTSQIFWNNGDGTFTDGTAAAGVGTDEDGMGSALGDFDGDGRLDWFVSALVDVPGGFPPHSGNRLYRNNGDRTFTDRTDAAAVRNSGWSWGTTFLDHDNDRDLDLFVTNGWDIANPDQSRLFQNNGGVFADISIAAGVTDSGMGRGMLSFDYDKDGDLDVFLVNHGARPILYRNDGGNENDWLRINVQGTASNRDGLGTFITVDPDTNVAGDEMVREINGANNYLSHNELTAHFGLGPNAEAVDLISVLWPSGTVEQLLNVLPNQVVNLVENAMTLPTPGDYNHDLTVDAADYVVWRKQLGSMGTGLTADGNGDSVVNQLDYDVWKVNFGAMSPGAAATAAPLGAVPEPSVLQLVIVGAAIGTCVTRSRLHCGWRYL